jgi:Protein of unknown function (DUF2568)
MLPITSAVAMERPSDRLRCGRAVDVLAVVMMTSFRNPPKRLNHSHCTPGSGTRAWVELRLANTENYGGKRRLRLPSPAMPDVQPATALGSALLAVRFALELCALAALGYWGFHTHSGAAAWLTGLGGPLAAALLWGALVAPKRAFGDAPPAVRLAAEAAVLAAAVAGLANAGRGGLGAALAVVWVADWGLLRGISSR